MDDMEPDRAEIHHDSCSEVAPSLWTPFSPDDDGNSASFFRMILRAGGYIGIFASVPSGGAASGGEQGDNIVE